MSCIAIYLIYQVPTQIPVCASVSTAIYLIHPAPVQIPVPVPVPVPVSAVLSTSTNTSYLALIKLPRIYEIPKPTYVGGKT